MLAGSNVVFPLGPYSSSEEKARWDRAVARRKPKGKKYWLAYGTGGRMIN
jgi:hypothetical protein